MRVIFDIEANGLKPSKIWVIVAKEIDNNGKLVTFCDTTIGDFGDYLRDNVVDEVIGHNIIGYDIPVLERLLGIDFTGIKLTDTLVLSRLANPQRDGGHSLKEWGIRLGDYKGDYNDWSKLTPEMVDYCQQDVEVTAKVYRAVSSELTNFGDKSISLEHRVQTIIQSQINNGWLINQEKAYILLAKLKEKKIEIEEQVHKTLSLLPKQVRLLYLNIKRQVISQWLVLSILVMLTAMCGESIVEWIFQSSTLVVDSK